MSDKKIEFSIVDDEEFREQIQRGDDESYNPYGSIKIGVQSLDAESSCLSVHFLDFLGQFLHSVDDLIAREKVVIQGEGGPIYLVFEPFDKEKVQFTICYSKQSVHNPEKRGNIEQAEIIGLNSLIEEIITTSQNFLNKIQRYNSDLMNVEEIEEFQKCVQRLKKEYC